MKKLITLSAIALLFISCAFAPLSSRIGEQTGKAYEKAYVRGIPSAEQIQQVWPFVSGLIKGTFAENYDMDLSVSLQRTVAGLDELAARKDLTDEDKGRIVGGVNRLEYLAGKEFQERYGATILNLIKALVM